MRISNEQLMYLLQYYRERQQVGESMPAEQLRHARTSEASGEKIDAGSRRDSVELSSEARRLLASRLSASAVASGGTAVAADIDAETVHLQAVRESVGRGDYHVDAATVAETWLRRMAADELALRLDQTDDGHA